MPAAWALVPIKRFATAKSWLRTMATPPVAQAKTIRPPIYPVEVAQPPVTRDRNVVLLRRAAVSPAPEVGPKTVYSGV